jgi:multidrug efflux pump subunit AcrB
MRKLITYFIKYEVAVNVVILAFVILGIAGMLQLKSSFFPLQDPEIITINIAYPGAAPQEIEEGIVLKVEDNLKGLIGIDRVTSVSRENGGSITVEIETGRDIDMLLAEVKNAVDRVPNFPTGMEPLVVAKQENVRRTIEFSISGENIQLNALKQIGRQIENDLRRIDGISQISVSGYPEEEIEIAVQEQDLLAYNMSFTEVAAAVSRANILTTGGNIKTDSEDYLIRANNRAYYGIELNNLVVRSNSDGSVVRLSDVAQVRDRFSESPNATYYNGNVSVVVNITNTNNEDLIGTSVKVRAYIEQFNEAHTGVVLHIINDAAVTLEQRTDLLLENGAIGIMLVLFFLSFFLNTRLAFWVAFGLPISFLGMFIFAAYFGVTINVLSLFGMIIVIGILVDDGIVISENIYQHYERGKPRVQAAIDGTMEVLPPILSAIITTILAFSTFLFLDGRIGSFFGEVSVVVILTLAVSLIEALIILPAHIAHSKALLKENAAQPARGFFARVFAKLRGLNKIGDRFMVYLRDRLYSPVLRFALRQRFITFSILVALMIVTVGALRGGIIRGAFFPMIASDQVRIDLLMPEGTNPSITDSLISKIEMAAQQVNLDFTERQTGQMEVIQNIVKQVGPGNNKASLSVNLLPGEERDFSSPEITNAIRQAVGPIYGVERLTYGSGSNFGGSPVSISLLGSNTAELKAAKEELLVELTQNALLADVADTDPEGIKEINVVLNETAYALGFTLQEVMSQVRSGFFGLQAQRFQRGQDEIRVWVRYDRINRESIADLDQMRLVAPSGDRVPFGEIATYSISRGDESISHLNGLREIQINADLKNPKGSATEILSDIQSDIMPGILSKYPTVTASFEGQNREANKLTKSARTVVPIIIFLIYMTIAFTFRSYSQPLLLLVMIPFSFIAVAWGHWIHDFPINILSALGIIALIGIMVNDGLVLIGKFNSYLREGLKFEEALYRAGRSRFRAIFLTSLTTIAGIGPLLIEKSRQAQFLIPMAISIAYGIAIATILTLIILPLLLSVTNELKMRIHWLIHNELRPREYFERAIKEGHFAQEINEGSTKDGSKEINND